MGGGWSRGWVGDRVGIAQSVKYVGLAILRDAVSWVQSSSELLVEGLSPLDLRWVLTPFPKTFF